jgi:hypothetical protein
MLQLHLWHDCYNILFKVQRKLHTDSGSTLHAPHSPTKNYWCVPVNYCASTSALGEVTCGGRAVSASGDGLPSDDESPPRRCESNTSSAICRPILLASTCVLIIFWISRPPAAEVHYRTLKYVTKQYPVSKFSHNNPFTTE